MGPVKLILVVSVLIIGFAFADQVSPHMRCGDTEKMTWNEELNKHECEPTSFVQSEEPVCPEFNSSVGVFNFSTSVYSVWKQTGPQTFEQVKCNEPITMFRPDKFETIDDWANFAWQFVFTERYGF